jgi:hypothetical protein
VSAIRAALAQGHGVRLNASPAAFIGMVETEDETTAVKAAVKQYRIRPEDERRVIAIRQPS